MSLRTVVHRLVSLAHGSDPAPPPADTPSTHPAPGSDRAPGGSDPARPVREPMLRRVLLAEDEPQVRAMLSEQLTSAGYMVVACSNGREAVAALERDTFDAVLSDIGMPDMDGLALLDVVRAKDLDVPVVLLTGGPSLETAVEAVARGALQYLAKPIPLTTLLEVTERAVRLGALARLKRQALLRLGLDHLVGDRAGLDATFARVLSSLRLDCQPIFHANGRLHAYEVLVRSGEPAFPNPGALLSAAEGLGRLEELGNAIRVAAAAILDSGAIPAGVLLYVNVHPHDLEDEALLDPAAPLSRHAGRVVLEVTERARLTDVANVPERIRRLRALGFRVALDDLGAGYAGLTSFTALAPDIVKLDMALLRGIDKDPVKLKLVTSMTRLCRELGILVVAEGIETAEELEAATNARCDLMQGYLLGRPAPLG
jgi:EAL domain-containing protein (putative c-di-GMP-specific phosphodiesterase class I)